jgi:hypothetical protein
MDSLSATAWDAPLVGVQSSTDRREAGRWSLLCGLRMGRTPLGSWVIIEVMARIGAYTTASEAAPAGWVTAGLRGFGTSVVSGLCCIWSAGGMLMPGSHWGQIAKTSSANATATRRLTGSSTATS